MSAVQSTLRELLHGSNSSRTFFTQAVLPGMTAGAQTGTSKDGRHGGGDSRGSEAAAADGAAAGAAVVGGGAAERRKKEPDPRKLVRTNGGMTVGELDRYVCRPSSSVRSGASLGGASLGGASLGGAAPGGALRPADGGGGAALPIEAETGGVGVGAGGAGSCGLGKRRAVAAEEEVVAGLAGQLEPAMVGSSGRNVGEASTQADGEAAGGGGGGPLRLPSGRFGAKRVALSQKAPRAWVPCELSSIASLLRAVTQRSHRGLGALFSGHTCAVPPTNPYVSCITTTREPQQQDHHHQHNHYMTLHPLVLPQVRGTRQRALRAAAASDQALRRSPRRCQPRVFLPAGAAPLGQYAAANRVTHPANPPPPQPPPPTAEQEVPPLPSRSLKGMRFLLRPLCLQT